MMFKEYVENLQKILDDNPEYEDLTVIYSTDREGTHFKEVYFEPSLGEYNYGDQFITEDEALSDPGLIAVNAVCIN